VDAESYLHDSVPLAKWLHSFRGGGERRDDIFDILAPEFFVGEDGVAHIALAVFKDKLHSGPVLRALISPCAIRRTFLCSEPIKETGPVCGRIAPMRMVIASPSLARVRLNEANINRKAKASRFI